MASVLLTLQTKCFRLKSWSVLISLIYSSHTVRDKYKTFIPYFMSTWVENKGLSIKKAFHIILYYLHFPIIVHYSHSLYRSLCRFSKKNSHRAKKFASGKSALIKVHTSVVHTHRTRFDNATRFFSFWKLIKQPMRTNFERYVDQITQNVIPLPHIWKI
jgi:hypothetical protein